MGKKNWLWILMLVLMAMMFVNVALAETYTLTYTFENHPFGTNSYTAEFEAGSEVMLDVSVGEVAENQGNMARMKSWTETVPDGVEPVQFSTSENQWGNTAYSFTMPARDVTVHGVWETVYSIVYVDNASYCDDKFEDEWHFLPTITFILNNFKLIVFFIMNLYCNFIRYASFFSNTSDC